MKWYELDFSDIKNRVKLLRSIYKSLNNKYNLWNMKLVKVFMINNREPIKFEEEYEKFISDPEKIYDEKGRLIGYRKCYVPMDDNDILLRRLGVEICAMTEFPDISLYKPRNYVIIKRGDKVSRIQCIHPVLITMKYDKETDTFYEVEYSEEDVEEIEIKPEDYYYVIRSFVEFLVENGVLDTLKNSYEYPSSIPMDASVRHQLTISLISIAPEATVPLLLEVIRLFAIEGSINSVNKIIEILKKNIIYFRDEDIDKLLNIIDINKIIDKYPVVSIDFVSILGDNSYFAENFASKYIVKLIIKIATPKYDKYIHKIYSLVKKTGIFFDNEDKKELVQQLNLDKLLENTPYLALKIVRILYVNSLILYETALEYFTKLLKKLIYDIDISTTKDFDSIYYIFTTLVCNFDMKDITILLDILDLDYLINKIPEYSYKIIFDMYIYSFIDYNTAFNYIIKNLEVLAKILDITEDRHLTILINLVEYCFPLLNRSGILKIFELFDITELDDSALYSLLSSLKYIPEHIVEEVIFRNYEIAEVVLLSPFSDVTPYIMNKIVDSEDEDLVEMLISRPRKIPGEIIRKIFYKYDFFIKKKILYYSIDISIDLVKEFFNYLVQQKEKLIKEGFTDNDIYAIDEIIEKIIKLQHIDIDIVKKFVVDEEDIETVFSNRFKISDDIILYCLSNLKLADTINILLSRVQTFSDKVLISISKKLLDIYHKNRDNEQIKSTVTKAYGILVSRKEVLPLEVIDDIIEFKDQFTLSLLIKKDQDIPEDKLYTIFDILVSYNDVYMLDRDRPLPEKILRILVSKYRDNKYVLLRIAKRTEQLPDDVIEKLANSKFESVRIAVAGAKYMLPEQVIRKLANDSLIECQVQLISRDQVLPKDVVMKFLRSDTPIIFVKTIESVNPLPRRTLEKLASDEHDFIRAVVARKKTPLPQHIIEKLANDPSIDVLVSLSSRPYLPDKVVEKLASIDNINILRNLLRNNYKLSEDIFYKIIRYRNINIIQDMLRYKNSIPEYIINILISTYHQQAINTLSKNIYQRISRRIAFNIIKQIYGGYLYTDPIIKILNRKEFSSEKALLYILDYCEYNIERSIESFTCVNYRLPISVIKYLLYSIDEKVELYEYSYYMNLYLQTWYNLSVESI